MNNRLHVGDKVIRMWNGKEYYICHDVDNGSEFLIDKIKGQKLSKCKICELPENLTKIEDK